MQSHHLDAFEASFVHANIGNLLKGPLCHLFLAEDAGLHLLDEAFFLRENYLLNLASIEENDSQDEQECCYEVLPPMAFSVALEENSQVSQSEVIEEVERSDHDKDTTSPDNAWKSSESQSVVA